MAHLRGRSRLDVPDNLHHVLAMGQAAARIVGPDANIDSGRWADDRAKFKSNVVED